RSWLMPPGTRDSQQKCEAVLRPAARSQGQTARTGGSVERDAPQDLQAVAAGARKHGGGRTQQQHVADTEIEQDLRPDAVVAQDVLALAGVRLPIAFREPMRIGIAD